MPAVREPVGRALPPPALLSASVFGTESFSLQVRGVLVHMFCECPDFCSSFKVGFFSSLGNELQGPGASQHLRVIVGVFPHPQR